MKIKAYIKKNISWLLAVFITAFSLLVIAVISGIAPFGDYSLLNSDCFQQYMPFFSEYRNKLLNGESLFYSWNVGGGADFFLIFTYYLACPLNLIIVFFTKSDFPAVISFLICFKICFSAGSFGYYLLKSQILNRKDPDEINEKEQNNKSKLNLRLTSMAVAYALCGYICGYYWNVMWLDSIMIFPLIILGMEKLIEEKKPALYILTLFYSMFCNYYFSFMICIYLVIHFFTFKWSNVKDFFRKGILFAVSSILAAAMSSVTLIASFAGLMSASSGNEAKAGAFFYGSFAKIISSAYFLSRPVITSMDDGATDLYCGTACIILLLVYPLVRKFSIRDKVSKLVVAAFLLLSMNHSFLNYVWHGFHVQQGIPNRFTIFFVFLILEIGYLVLSNIESIDIKRLIPGCVISIILPLVIYIFTDFNGMVSSKTMLVLALVLSFIYSVLIIVGRNNSIGFVFRIIIPVLFIIEVVISAYFTIRFNGLNQTGPALSLMDTREEGIEHIKSEADKEANNSTSLFYREDLANGVIYNESVYHNIKGTGAFSSTIDRSFIDDMGTLGYKINTSYYLYYSNTMPSPLIDDMMGIKYIHAFDDERKEAGYEVTFSDNNGGVVYENTDALPIGYGVQNALLTDYYVEDYDGAYNQNQFVECSTGLQGPFMLFMPVFDVSSNCCEVSYNQEASILTCQNIAGTLDNGLFEVVMSGQVPLAGRYFISLQNDMIENVIISYGDEKKSIVDGSLMMIDISELAEGQQFELTLYISPRGGNSYAIPVYMSMYDHDLEMQAVKKLSENPFVVSSYTSNTISGDVELSDGQVLFMTIPYSDCWSVYVDGKPVDPQRIMYGFTCLDIGAGKHHIEMKYVPKCFYLGLIISIIAWVVFICCIILSRRSKNKNEINSESEEVSEIEEEG